MLVISMIVRLSSNKWLWLSVAKARTEKPHGAVGHMFGRVSEISSVYIILNGGRHHKLRLIYIYISYTVYIYIHNGNIWDREEFWLMVINNQRICMGLYIWVDYNNSPSWIKTIWWWCPLLTMIPGFGRSEVVIKFTQIYIYIHHTQYIYI